MSHFKLILFLLFSVNLYSQSYIEYWKKGNKIASIDAPKGLRNYEKALIEAHKSGDWIWENIIRADLCGSYFNINDFDKALSVCQDGLSLMKNKHIRNDSVTFRLISASAPCYHKLYRFDQAASSFETAAQILRLNPEVSKQTPLFVTYYYINYAYFLIELFDLEKARVMLSNAARIAKGLKNPIHYARANSLLSNIYAFSGEYEKGIMENQELLELFKKSKFVNPTEKAKVYYMLGYFYTRLSQDTKAIEHFNLAKDSGKNLNDIFKYYEMSEIDKCENYLNLGKVENVKKILKSFPDKTGNIEVDYYKAMAWGAYFYQIKDFNKSLESYKDAFNVLFPGDNLEKFNVENIKPHRLKLFEILNKIGGVYQQKYILEKAARDLYLAYNFKVKSIKLGKQIRQFQENMDSKVLFTHKYHDVYKDVVKLGFNLVYENPKNRDLVNEVFDYAEEAKSVVLTDPLLLKSTKRNQKSDSLMIKIQANQAYLSYLKSLNDKSLADEIIKYETKVQDLWAQFSKINKSLSDRILNQSEKVEIPENAIYVNYILMGEELYVFCKNSRHTWMKKLLINSKIFDKNLEELRTQLTSVPSPYEGFTAIKSSEYLFEILINRVIPKWESYEKLMLNPDNKFFDISFDILKNGKTGKYLIENVAISYTSSLQLSKQRSSEFNWSGKKWVALFPFAFKSEDLISGLKPLRFSTAEIKGIKSENFYNYQASKSLFTDKLQNNSSSPLIIATHASIGENNDPYLFFNSKRPSDTRLFASEIRNFDIKTPLVVLSACATHQGKTYHGLGARSFAAAISWAGCPSVAATLWEVDDESMSILTSLFYKNLLGGMPKDQALRNAKLSYLQTSVGKARDLPFYWAHFQIIGSTEPIVSPLEIYLPYLLAFFVGLNLLWIFRKRLFFKP